MPPPSQELLIARTNKPGIFNLLHVYFNNGRRYFRTIAPMDHDQDIAPKVDVKPMSLPYELVRIIIFKTIFWMLQNKYIPEACALMCINKDMIHFFHTHFVSMVHVGKINYMGEFRRLSRTMWMANRLHDTIMDEINFTRAEYFAFEMYILNPKYELDQNGVEPLDCYRRERNGTIIGLFEMIDSPKPVIRDYHCFEGVVTGAQFLDVAWLMGYQGHRYFKCLEIKRPVFAFVIKDPFGKTISPSLTGYHYYVWHRFSKLLKNIYGPCTGVYLVMNDELNVSPGVTTMELKEVNW